MYEVWTLIRRHRETASSGTIAVSCGCWSAAKCSSTHSALLTGANLNQNETMQLPVEIVMGLSLFAIVRKLRSWNNSTLSQALVLTHGISWPLPLKYRRGITWIDSETVTSSIITVRKVKKSKFSWKQLENILTFLYDLTSEEANFKHYRLKRWNLRYNWYSKPHLPTPSYNSTLSVIAVSCSTCGITEALNLHAAADVHCKHILKPTTYTHMQTETWGWGFTAVAPGQGRLQQQLLIKGGWLNSYS